MRLCNATTEVPGGRTSNAVCGTICLPGGENERKASTVEPPVPYWLGLLNETRERLKFESSCGSGSKA